MAPLPVPRATPRSPCFLATEVDYIGPLLAKIVRKQAKRYVCIMTRLATRAILIEVAYSLETSSFIQAFRGFTFCRGRPAQIFSDNGTNFVVAEREL